jgi:hypothetical protein
MSRDLDISHLNIEETEREMYHYDRSGELISERKTQATNLDFNESRKTYAIKQQLSKGGVVAEHYWVIINRGEIVDPYGTDAHMSILGYKLCNFQKVSKTCFQHYQNYLTTERRSYYTKARRTLTSK